MREEEEFKEQAGDGVTHASFIVGGANSHHPSWTTLEADVLP